MVRCSFEFGSRVGKTLEKNQLGPRLVLVLGGARSGKSAFAERLLMQLSDNRVYLATAQARDEEMSARIKAHQWSRGDGWDTLEVPLDLSGALSGIEGQSGVLVDCLTLWLSNQMEIDADLEQETDALLAGFERLDGPLVMVSNELGMGLVPETALGRSFRDAQGRLNQRAAQVADLVVFVAAGLPIVLKGELP